jgi:predicted ATP-dependent protease
VNEKIEGFFELCANREGGLTGDQGVVIPKANVKHLCLRSDVVGAVERGEFNVFAIETADEGLSIFTGLEAGSRDEAGEYPAGSVNQLIETRLATMAEAAEKRARETAGR